MTTVRRSKAMVGKSRVLGIASTHGQSQPDRAAPAIPAPRQVRILDRPGPGPEPSLASATEREVPELDRPRPLKNASPTILMGPLAGGRWFCGPWTRVRF